MANGSTPPSLLEPFVADDHHRLRQSEPSEGGLTGSVRMRSASATSWLVSPLARARNDATVLAGGNRAASARPQRHHPITGLAWS